MSAQTFPCFETRSALLLADGDYLPYTSSRIRHAVKRVWASIFIIDVRTHRDRDRDVRGLLAELVAADRRGVDVRLVIGRPRDASSIYLANITTYHFLSKFKRLPVRVYRPAERDLHHSKYVVVDDSLVISGSHNWTHDAFNDNVELSVAVESVDLNGQLADEFARNWTKSEPPGA